MIAVTGSVGKTTTRDILGAILSTRWSTLIPQANYNNDIGLPLTLLRLGVEHKAAVVELAMGPGKSKDYENSPANCSGYYQC